MTRQRRLLWIAAAAVVVTAAVLIMTRPVRLDVDVATIDYDTLRVTIEEEGRTRARDRYTIAAPVTGRLARITLEEGDTVSADATVARLFPVPEDPRAIAATRARIAAAEARHNEAAARVEQLAAQHEQAVREAERRKRVFETGGLTRELVEQAALAAATAGRSLEGARASLRAADAEVDAARALLLGATGEATSRVDVRAPVAGRVLRVHEESERVVPAGTPLVELADVGGLEIVVDVLSEDAVRVAPGDPVLITGWGGDDPLEAVVRLVEPAAFTKVSALGVEEQRVNIVGDLLHAPPALGSGYRVTAAIVTWQADRVLVVPTSALFRRGQAWQAFVVEDGRARLRDVELGPRGRDAAEVRAGLGEGDAVILFPSAALADGVRVRSTAGSGGV